MKLRLWCILVAICWWGSTSVAVPVAVPNFSFESPNLIDSGATNTIPGWLSAGVYSGVRDTDNAAYAGATGNNSPLPGTAAGGQDAFISLYPFPSASLASISTSVGTLEANIQYILTVALGNPLDADPGLVGIGFQLGSNPPQLLQIGPAAIPN